MSNLLKEKFLLFRIRSKKDPEAFGKIYDAYVTPIYRFIYFKVPTAELAEDLTSEVFLKAWQYLKEKREVSHLQAFLYSIARSVVIDYYRSSAHSRGDLQLDETLGATLTDNVSEKLLRAVETEHDAGRVLEKLRGLKDDYREVIVMKFVDEFSTREIAKILGKTSGTVRVLLHRAIKVLAGAMENEQNSTQEHPAKHKE